MSAPAAPARRASAAGGPARRRLAALLLTLAAVLAAPSAAPARRASAAGGPARRRLAALLLTLAAVLAAPSAASAALPWAACSPGGFECARLDVPLDRSGGLPGAVSLNVTRLRTAPANRTAVVGLAGGPGQAAVPIAPDFAGVLGSEALASRDLLVFDQRGTGGSDALRCGALRRRGTVISVARDCAQELGPRRGMYRSADTVQDLEALRVAAGYDKLVLLGVSYGTKVALDYAAAFPDRVEALVLDSLVLPEGPDPFRRSSLAAVPRVLGDLCAGDACRAATGDVKRDVTRLAAKLRRHTLRGTVVDDRGRRRRASLGQTGLFAILLAGDLNPTLRAELPGAMRAALLGDRAPILRLSARSAGLQNGMQAAAADSDALFLATTCEEAPFTWTRGAGTEQRADEISAVARTIPKATLGPFSPRVALEGGVIPLCLGWPAASPPPATPGALPAVRTLVLDGQMDLRTPVEDAARLRERLPSAEVVSVPFTGHSVLGADLTTCARDAVRAFLAGAAATACPATENAFNPTPRPPRRLGQLRGGSKRSRTVSAVAATVLDARRQVIGETLAQGRVPSRVGGLRGGTVTPVDGGRYRLSRYEYVPGVVVSGTVDGRGAGTVTVRGRAATRGRLRLGSAAAAAAEGGTRLPTLREVLALPGLG